MFVRTYGSNGRIIRSDGHLYRSRTGGDTSSTAGYNIGSALSNINARGKMLKSAFLAITGDQDAPTPTGPAEGATFRTVAAVQSPPTTPAARATSANGGPESGNAQNPARMDQVIAEISSEPLGADIEIYGNFLGSTPSSLGIADGGHTLRISEKGYNQS